MLHPWIRGRIWAYGVPNQHARFDAVVLRSRCYSRLVVSHIRLSSCETIKWQHHISVYIYALYLFRFLVVII